MNHTTKSSSTTLMGITIAITAILYSPPTCAKLLIKNVTEAKAKAGQSCFAENNYFVVVYCNDRTQETDNGSGDCRDDSYTMSTSGYCKLPGGGDGIGTAYCVGDLPVANTCNFCRSKSSNIPDNTLTSPDLSFMYTEDGYSPYVYYYYDYKTPQTTTTYSCDGGTRTKKYTCMPGSYAYDIDASGRIEECPQCPTFAGTEVKTTFPSRGNITSCYASTGTYTDKTGTFDLLDKCYYTK